MRIYLDNAATTPIDPIVIEEMNKVMRESFANPSSIHADGRKARVLIEQSRKTVATALNASVGEIFFTSSGTESNNTALRCAVRDLNVKRIITSKIEHHCVLRTIQNLDDTSDIEVVYLDTHDEELHDLHQLQQLLENDDRKTLVSLMHANNETGCMMNLEKISEICYAHNALLHTDTVQTVGHYPLDVQKLHISFLSASAHKFHGPKGAGFLYINTNNIIKPFISGGGQERNMRAGTENIYGIVGLAKALELAIDEMDKRKEHILHLRGLLRQQILQKIPGAYVVGADKGAFLYTVLNISFPPSEKTALLLLNLDMKGISVSSGSACSSGSLKKSHVMEAMGEVDENRAAIRFSFSHFNTEEEIFRTVESLSKILPATLAPV